MGKGLHDIGKKTAPLIPGLIDLIVKLCFQSSGVSHFLSGGAHLLLIIVIVAFPQAPQFTLPNKQHSQKNSLSG